jgi:hypothetical protein
VDPLTAVVLIVVAVSGFGAGWAVKPSPQTDEILHAHSQSLDAVLDGQTEMLTEISRPVVIDASIRAKLSDTPSACIDDSKSMECILLSCWAAGQSTANRPECDDLKDEIIRRSQQSCPESAE